MAGRCRGTVAVLVVFAVCSLAMGCSKHALTSDRAADRYFAMAYEAQNLSRTSASEDSQSTAKIVKRAAMVAVLDDPRKGAETVSQRVSELGGYVAQIKHSKASYGSKTEMVLRVPADQLDEMRRSVLALARDVVSDETTSEDVTKRYRDLELILRNYRAEEEQYLAIMKRAQKVSEVLEVTQRLSEVRGRIDQTEADLKSLSHDIAMSVLTLELIADTQAQAAGVRWRPLIAIRKSFYEALGSFGEFGSAMMFILFHIPIAILWIVVIVAALLYGWKLVKVIVRLLPGIRSKRPERAT
jgi:hypothetical protein